MKEEEDFELVTTIDRSLTAAMDALGNDLKDYLKEAETMHKKEKEEKKEEKHEGILEPFIGIGRGFQETFGQMLPKKKKETPAKQKAQREMEENNAWGLANSLCWTNYKLFKKSHRLLTW
jgi:hypothetical protein